MDLPIILINFKTYRESAGKNAVKFANICNTVAKKFAVNIWIAPQYIDIIEIKKKTDLPIFAQHIDPIEPGAYTGHIAAENLKQISGTLINHSERKLEKDKIAKCIRIAKNLGLISVCCSATPWEAREIAKLDPDFIAIEPPELIGSGISVSTAKPKIVTRSIDEIRKINLRVKVFCGAGITNGEDVKRAIKLGTSGILVASSVIKSKNPKKVLIGFVKALSTK